MTYPLEILLVPTQDGRYYCRVSSAKGTQYTKTYDRRYKALESASLGPPWLFDERPV